jgi:hypothetical protein
MPEDDCDPIEIDCKTLEDILRGRGLIRPGCKLDEGPPTIRGKKGYVFNLVPTNNRDTKKDKKK